VNRARKYTDEEFLFVSALRGICEDLISLAYFSKMSVENRRKITKLLIEQTVAEGLEVQRAFFEANNPFQPVLAPSKAERRRTYLFAKQCVHSGLLKG
jgi:hypothetical protein